MKYLRYRFSKLYEFGRTAFTQLFKRGKVVKMSAYWGADGNLMKLNWGDDINYWFLNEISENPIVSYDLSVLTRMFHRKYILGIGSLLTIMPIDNAIVWGSGLLSDSDPINGRPAEVRAVRGPLTRKRLIDAGIECPQVYGDPALLLPRYYQPEVTKKYRLGIILHYKDADTRLLDSFRYRDDVQFINIRDYGHWLSFIDRICECEAIVSTSLHGLIVSEAYSIPNLWIKLAGDDKGDDIKFHDFFMSMGVDRQPQIVGETFSVEQCLTALKSYKKGHINLDRLIECSPLRLKKNYTITYNC